MLDREMIDQLKGVFKKLDKPVWLAFANSSHASQSELIEMFEGLKLASTNIQTRELGITQNEPYFEIHSDKTPTGISFRGVPGGHEFSSLVIAILNANGKGKYPDAQIQNRIKNIKGPLQLKTFVSLSCENCPDVVQSLNLMAFLNPNFKNETLDGAVVPSEVERLKVQGVPAVFSGDKLLFSGKTNLTEILDKLENEFGTENPSQTGISKDLGEYDVLVLGGGPAGASAAIYSARKGLKVALLAERLGGQLMDTLGIENMISTPYTEGKKLAAQLNEHLAAYPISVFEHRKIKQIQNEKIKTVELESGEFLHTKTLIVATGAKWRTLGVPGEKENIGRGVAFCAHCDGPFYKGKNVVVVGGGNSGVEAALDLAAIATSVTLLEFASELKADKVLINKLHALSNAKVITNAKTTEVIEGGGKVVALKYEDRLTHEVKSLVTDGIFVQIGLIPNSQFLKGLVDLTPFGEVTVDNRGRTSAPGIYAAGDVTTIPFKQIITAMGDGAKVALAAFEDQMKSA